MKFVFSEENLSAGLVAVIVTETVTGSDFSFISVSAKKLRLVPHFRSSLFDSCTLIFFSSSYILTEEVTREMQSLMGI